MDEAGIQLSAYFGERQRSGRRFLADAMLELYEEHEVSTSIVLRGIAGFGSRHQFRTDQLLSLSEDPPVAVIAVDDAPKIESLLEQLFAIEKRGLISLSRARLLRDDSGGLSLTTRANQALKLTVFVGRKERVYGVPAFVAVCDLFYRRKLAGASVFMGVDGTMRGHRERAAFFDRNSGVPVMIVAFGTGERIRQVLAELGGLLRHPVITTKRVQVCKRDGLLFERPHLLPEADDRGMALWQRITVYSSEAARHDGMPIHRAIIDRLRHRHGSRGATVLRGVWGFYGDHEPHGDRLFAFVRRVPVASIVVDTPGGIADSFAVIDEITSEHGLVTCETVPALVADDDDGREGARMAEHEY